MRQAREAAELGQKLREARARAKELGEAVERERQATALATSELEVRAPPPASHQASGQPHHGVLCGRRHDALHLRYPGCTGLPCTWHPAALQALCMGGRESGNVIKQALLTQCA